MKSLTKKPSPKKKKRKPLSQQRIIQTAMILADKNGIEGISMRILGKELSVEAMSLYKHVKNKEEILDGLADLLVSMIEFPEDSITDKNPSQALKILFSNKRKIFLKHKWAPQVIESRIAFSPTRFEFMEKQFTILMKNGYSMMESYQVLLSLESYVYGFCIQEMNWNFELLPKEEKEALKYFIGSDFETLSKFYPNFFSFLDFFFKKFKTNQLSKLLDDEFERGLDIILNSTKK
jgi:AcrR family transcriptional regulator